MPSSSLCTSLSFINKSLSSSSTSLSLSELSTNTSSVRSRFQTHQTHGSPTRTSPILNNPRHPQRINLHPQTVSKNLLPHHLNSPLPSLLCHLSSLSLHPPTPDPHPRLSTRPDPNPAPMDSPPPLPIPLPYLPLCFLSPLHCRHSLHCSISLHLKASLFLLHNLGHSQRFQALVRYLLMGFSSNGDLQLCLPCFPGLIGRSH